MRPVVLLLTALFSWWPLHAATGVVPSLSPEIRERSLLAEGDLDRLRATLAKARCGEPVTIAFIGGSITQGASATKPENRYAERVSAWWKQTFPRTRFTTINAGIGATGSNYGSLRASRDLLSHDPDFVVVDFGVNDKAGRELAECYEGLLRQILKHPGNPALVLLFMSRNDGVNAQEWQARVGAHYQLPMISYRDALWPEVTSGRLAWSEIGADYIHPNDAGHALTATFITRLLDRALASVSERTPATEPALLPRPLLSDVYERTTLLEAENLEPLRNEGWAYDAALKAWVSSAPGSVIEFAVSGRVLFLMDYHLNAPMGKARVQVDDRPAVTRDGWFDKTWGGYRETVTLADDLKPGAHRVRIELLEEKNAQSAGHEFRILGLGSAGLDPAPQR